MKSTLWFLGVVVLVAAWASPAEASKWRHTRLKSKAGVGLRIDRQHQVKNTGNTKPTMAHSAKGYLNVLTAGLTDKSRATVTITSYPNYNGYEYGGAKTMRVELKPSESKRYGKHLSAKLPKLSTGQSGYAGNHTYRQSIQLWVTWDGKTWHRQIDPINGTDRFQTYLGL